MLVRGTLRPVTYVLALIAVLCLLPGQAARAEVPAADIGLVIERLVAVDSPRIDGRRLDGASLREVYTRQGFRPLWLERDGGRRRAAQLLEVLSQAPYHGLRTQDYAVAAIEDRLGADAPEPLAELELLLTHEMLHYASDLRSGRVAARAVDPELFIHPGKIDRQAVIEDAKASSDLRRVLKKLAPSNTMYRRLRRALADHRSTARQGGWPVLAGGRRLEEGVTHPRVRVLRRRLIIAGDLYGEGHQPETFDGELTLAVQRFQRRHGLKPDGVVGPATRAQLNVPVERRIEQILLSMERWRWMPDDLGRRHILVNLAGFELQVIEDGWPALAMPVIVGRPYRRTPVFTARMSYVEVNPFWTVPPSIAVRDYLPKLRRDPAALTEQQIRVFSSWRPGARELDPRNIDWSRVSAGRFPYMLRQDPGHRNALGRIKFMMPNRFSIYLHDTPSVTLFERRVRTFSSGCIRLQEPAVLADYLFKDNPAWPPERIEEEILSGRTKQVPLSDPIPVHITYSTAWVDAEGLFHFRNDVYDRDALLARALFGGKPGVERAAAK